MRILIVDRPLVKEKENWVSIIDFYKRGWDVFVFPFIKKQENDLLIAEYFHSTSCTGIISNLFDYRTSFGKFDEESDYEGYYLSISEEEKIDFFIKEIMANMPDTEIKFLTKIEKGQ
jgi:hypothetical protein